MGIENDLNISAVLIIININSIMMLLPATVQLCICTMMDGNAFSFRHTDDSLSQVPMILKVSVLLLVQESEKKHELERMYDKIGGRKSHGGSSFRETV